MVYPNEVVNGLGEWRRGIDSRQKSMSHFIRLTKTTLAFVVFFIACAGPALSHPHAWIDLRSTVLLDADGRAIAIEQQWLFDEFYSVFAREEIENAKTTKAEALAALTRSNLDNLRAYDYFTEVHVGGTKLRLDTVTEFESEMRDGRLWMRFVVPLKKPVDRGQAGFAFAVFDPTYYIAIRHLDNESVAFRGARGSECRGRIITPKPSTEVVLKAQAMDRDATPDATLGRLFAERVDVKCG